MNNYGHEDKSGWWMVSALYSMILSGAIIIALSLYLGWAFWEAVLDTIGRYKFLVFILM